MARDAPEPPSGIRIGCDKERIRRLRIRARLTSDVLASTTTDSGRSPLGPDPPGRREGWLLAKQEAEYRSDGVEVGLFAGDVLAVDERFA